MKTKGFSIGIIFLVLMVCTTCTKDEALLTPDGKSSALKAIPVEGIVFTIYPSGEDDTQNIIDAFEGAKAEGPGSIVFLTEGEFIITKTIVIDDFEGTFTGAGKDKTFIHNPVSNVDEFPLFNDGPSSFFVISDAVISIMDMTMEFHGLTVEILIPDIPSPQSLWGMIAFSKGGEAKIHNLNFKGNDVHGYRYNVRGAVNLLGDFDNEIPTDVNVLVESCYFTNNGTGIDIYNAAGSVLIKGNLFENNYRGIIEHQSYGAQVEIYDNAFIGNIGSAVYIAHNILSYQSEIGLIPVFYPWPDPLTEQSQYLIHKNDFNVSENSTGLDLFDFSFGGGRGKTLGIEIKSNNFILNKSYDGIFNGYSEDALISNNKFTGSAGYAIFAVKANRMVVLGDNINGMTETFMDYPIVLWYQSTNCIVTGNTKTSVLDEGENNTLTGVQSNPNPIGPEIRDIINDRIKKMHPNSFDW